MYGVGNERHGIRCYSESEFTDDEGHVERRAYCKGAVLIWRMSMPIMMMVVMMRVIVMRRLHGTGTMARTSRRVAR